MGDLWTPRVSAAGRRSVFAVGRPYATGSQVLGEMTTGDARQQLWARIPVGHALALLSGMLRDVDLEDPSVEAAESSWAGELSEPVRSRALAAVRSGSRLLAPQLLQLAMQEALRFCPPGEARDDLSDVPMVLRAVWSIGDELGHARDEQSSWGGFPATLAADLLASQHFNTVARPLPLIGRTDAMWRHGWSSTVKPRLQALAGGSPSELFAAATGCELDDFLGVALHLWVQAQQHRYLTYPAEFFSRLGIPTAAVDRFLAATSVTLDELRADAAGRDPITRPWDFNQLRRRPLVRLPNGSVQVIRLGFVLARAFGQIPEFDVREHLRHLDGACSCSTMARGGREEAFRSALDLQFEHTVGALLHRVFPAGGRLRRLYTEREMGKAWRFRGQTPSVCDWAVDCGRVWLLFDATNRRLLQDVVGGLATPDILDVELKKVLAEKKADQIASTIRLLTNKMPQLTSRNVLPGIRFLPLIVIPEDGLPWSSAVHRRVQEILRESGRLQGTRVEPLGVITLDDLGLIERAVDDGRDAAGLLVRWRREAPDMPLSNFLYSKGNLLRRPEREVAVFHRLTDELLDRMTRHNDSLPRS